MAIRPNAVRRSGIERGMNASMDQDEAARISNAAATWKLAAAISLFVGLSPVAGPIAWWKGSKYRERLRALGAATTEADATVRVATAVTALTALGAAAIALVVIGIRRGPTY